MPVLLKSTQGVGRSLVVNTKTVEKLSEDGNLEIDIIENKATFDEIGAITKMWTITNVGGGNDEREYRIIQLDKSTLKGGNLKLSIKARPVEIDDLNNTRIYEVYNGSFTGQKYFDLVFKNTGYKYYMHTKVDALKFENLGNHDTNLEVFQKGLEAYDLEYHYASQTKTFHIYDRISNEVDYFIKAGVNANNVKIQEDASKCYTYIRGYGGFDDQQTFNEASLQFEYTHPLAEQIGKRHAPPVIDGRVYKGETLDKMMKKVIDESLKVSITLDFIMLKKYFPKAIVNIGDIVPTIDNSIGLNVNARIVEITTYRDTKNHIYKQDIVLGDFESRTRYKKALYDAANYVKGINASKSDTGKTLGSLKAQTTANTKISQDLLGKTETLKQGQKDLNAKSVTTANGTIMHDFTTKSKTLKKIKTIGTIGDSVGYGLHADKSFTQQIAKKIKAKYTVLAKSRATFSTSTDNNIYDQSKNIKGDLIIVQGTDDDWINNINIGTDETDTKTFYGAFCSSIKNIKKNNPKAKILVMTALRQCAVGDDKKVYRQDTDKNKLNLTLEDYVNAQVKACNDLDVPVFDAYHSNYFKPYNPAFRKANMPDGVHPNTKLHEVIMYELIKDYYEFYDA